ncbi:MAG: hypothetical protein ACLP7Q_04690 [Isosphaeraceae bacterium]
MRLTLAEAPLVVSTDGTAGPYITVTTDQLKPVTQALQAEGIAFEVDDDAVVLEGRPALSVIDLEPGADAKQVQQILDRLNAGWRGTSIDGGAAPRSQNPVSVNLSAAGATASAGGVAPSSQNELIVRFESSEFTEFLRRLESDLPPGWTRRPELEERRRKMRAMSAGAYCFTKTFEPGLGEVAVWLQNRGTKELYVPSVVAINARRPLTVEQHNQVLEDFERSFIEPLTEGLRRHVFHYQAPSEPTLDDVLSADSMRRLRAFSATANKAMPHPLDFHRWHVFIARTHLEDCVVDPTLLSDWLQGEGWSEDQRRTLVEQFKLGRAILSVYDEERAVR